jgi:transcriptional regulator with XRE-family HTH domain
MQTSTPANPRLVSLGRAIRQLRRDRGLSQSTLAERSGLHPNHISQIERGTKDPRITTLFRLLSALETSAADLAGVMAADERGARQSDRELAPSQAVGSRNTRDVSSVDGQRTSLIHRVDDARAVLSELRVALEHKELR